MSDKHSESASQETIWDLDIGPITRLTNAEFLNAISVDDSPGRNTDKRGMSPGSVLSAPSGLLSPTIGKYSNTRVVCYVVGIASRSKALYIFLFSRLS